VTPILSFCLTKSTLNKVFSRTQSFVAGPPTNVQFMVKDAKEYASTGGWGFAQFDDGKPADIVVNDCFSCHVPVKDRDFIFTRCADRNCSSLKIGPPDDTFTRRH
jgi:hypothetical protein